MPAWIDELDTVTVLGAGLVVLACLAVALFALAIRWRQQRDDARRERDDARLRAAAESCAHLDAERRINELRRDLNAAELRAWRWMLRHYGACERLEKIGRDHPELRSAIPIALVDAIELEAEREAA